MREAFIRPNRLHLPEIERKEPGRAALREHIQDYAVLPDRVDPRRQRQVVVDKHLDDRAVDEDTKRERLPFLQLKGRPHYVALRGRQQGRTPPAELHSPAQRVVVEQRLLPHEASPFLGLPQAQPHPIGLPRIEGGDHLKLIALKAVQYPAACRRDRDIAYASIRPAQRSHFVHRTKAKSAVLT